MCLFQNLITAWRNDVLNTSQTQEALAGNNWHIDLFMKKHKEESRLNFNCVLTVNIRPCPLKEDVLVTINERTCCSSLAPSFHWENSASLTFKLQLWCSWLRDWSGGRDISTVSLCSTWKIKCSSVLVSICREHEQVHSWCARHNESIFCLVPVSLSANNHQWYPGNYALMVTLATSIVFFHLYLFPKTPNSKLPTLPQCKLGG